MLTDLTEELDSMLKLDKSWIEDDAEVTSYPRAGLQNGGNGTKMAGMGHKMAAVVKLDSMLKLDKSWIEDDSEVTS